MERVIATLVGRSDSTASHEILALDGVTGASSWIKNDGAKLIHFSRGASQLDFLRALAGVIRCKRPDLLMTYNWGATDAIWLGRALGIPRIIHSEHGYCIEEHENTMFKRDLMRFLVYRLASKVVVVSRDLQWAMQQRYRLDGDRVALIPNGIDTVAYSPSSESGHQMRKRLGFGVDDRVVGYVGRLDPVKNLGFLARAFAASVRENDRSRLLVVGTGPEHRTLLEVLRAQDVDRNVVFAGQQHDVVPYLRAMDVLLLTSLREQMPMCILEAMSVGVPVVATRAGEVPYLVDDGVTGFVHGVDEPVDKFVASLSALGAAEVRCRMGIAARQKVLNEYDARRMSERYSEIMGCI